MSGLLLSLSIEIDSPPFAEQVIATGGDSDSVESVAFSELVFVAETGGQWDLWIWDGRSDPVRLTDTPDDELRPSVSRDGRIVAFANSSGEHRVIDRATGGVTTLRNRRDGAWYVWPVVSPDGSLVADCRRAGLDGDDTALAISALSLPGAEHLGALCDSWRGDGAELVLDAAAPQFSPCWSLDQGRLCFVQVLHQWSGRTVSELFCVGVTAAFGVQITLMNSLIIDPSFSGDDRVCFSSNASGSFDVYDVDIQSGRTRRLTSDPAADMDPIALANGGTLFVSTRSGVQELWEVEEEGGQPWVVRPFGVQVPCRDPACR